MMKQPPAPPSEAEPEQPATTSSPPAQEAAPPPSADDTPAAGTSLDTPPPITPERPSAKPIPAYTPEKPSPRQPSAPGRFLLGVACAASVAALVLAGLLWRDARQLQSTVAHQLASMQQQAQQSSALAQQASEYSQATQTRMGTLESRLSDLHTRHAQIDSALQNVARQQDEVLLAELDTTVQLGLQQAQLAGHVQPLLAALQRAQEHIAHTSQPQLMAVRQAMLHDMDRLRQSSSTDMAVLLRQLGQILQDIDSLPLRPADPAQTGPEQLPPDAGFWQRNWQRLRQQLGHLVRIHSLRDGAPVHLRADQASYLRENIRLHLFAVRMGLLARQPELGHQDLDAVHAQITQHFDTTAPQVQAVLAAVQGLRRDIPQATIPAVSDTLTALASARATLTRPPAAASPVPTSP